jgi:hypothetical protein
VASRGPGVSRDLAWGRGRCASELISGWYMGGRLERNVGVRHFPSRGSSSPGWAKYRGLSAAPNDEAVWLRSR